MPSISPYQSLCIFWTICLKCPGFCRALPHTSFRCLPNCLLGTTAERTHTYTHSCWLLSAPLLLWSFYQLSPSDIFLWLLSAPPTKKRSFFSLKKFMFKYLSFSMTSNTHPLADLGIFPHFPLSRSFIVAVRVAFQRASQPSWIVFL